MKRIFSLLFLFTILTSINIVNARENKLYFTNSGDRLYYDSSLYEDEYFMKHLDMIPGFSFEDKLIIENGSNYDYKLYMRVKNVEQSKLAQELLENIKMDIYLDGELLYTGFADGLDYSHNGLDLTNTVYIGEYEAKRNGEIVVHTKLSEEYSNTENEEMSFVEWEFIAEYNDLVIPINPDTSKDSSQYIKIIVISLSLSFLILLIFIFGIERRKLIIKKL